MLAQVGTDVTAPVVVSTETTSWVGAALRNLAPTSVVAVCVASSTADGYAVFFA